MKDDIKRVRTIARKNKLTPEQELEFCEYIHWLKEHGYGGSGKNGDFTFHELDEMAGEIRHGKK